MQVEELLDRRDPLHLYMIREDTRERVGKVVLALSGDHLHVVFRCPCGQENECEFNRKIELTCGTSGETFTLVLEAEQ